MPSNTSRVPASLGPLEDQVMRIIWARDQATVRDVLGELTRRRVTLAYTTVMTVMARLATKGLLSRRRVGRSFLYEVRIKEAAFRMSTARMLAQRLVRGFDHLAIASFVEEVAKVGPDRLRELQEAVRQAKEEGIESPD
ncbi:MAG TPA: BlaI/MecI/CopY family transcriptional regulator [Dehalococcoidia bacterium]|nr:BlaI/MecI/CopY family transcriptional regulator [Dehalococcoidia bacterium]